MICDRCKKLIATDRGKRKCAVLYDRSKPGKLPVWGPKCSAYTDDPDWEKKVNLAVERYRLAPMLGRAKGGK